MTVCPYCGDDPSTPVLERYSFTLELAWPNPQHAGKSTHLHNSGSGRWAYKRLRDEFTTKMEDAIFPLQQMRVPRRLHRVTLTRLWGPRKRAWDRDNLVAGAKPIVDALVRAGALVDDSEQYARIHYRQRKREHKAPCAVHVLIEVLDVPVAK